jgi:hypothetical protein
LTDCELRGVTRKERKIFHGKKKTRKWKSTPLHGCASFTSCSTRKIKANLVDLSLSRLILDSTFPSNSQSLHWKEHTTRSFYIIKPIESRECREANLKPKPSIVQFLFPISYVIVCIENMSFVRPYVFFICCSVSISLKLEIRPEVCSQIPTNLNLYI